MISSDNYRVLKEEQRAIRRMQRRRQVQCMRQHHDLVGLIDLLWHLCIAPLWGRLVELEAVIQPETLPGSEDTAEEHCWRHTMAVLQRLGGNKMATSRALNISVKTLYNWLHRWEEQNRRRVGA